MNTLPTFDDVTPIAARMASVEDGADYQVRNFLNLLSSDGLKTGTGGSGQTLLSDSTTAPGAKWRISRIEIESVAATTTANTTVTVSLLNGATSSTLFTISILLAGLPVVNGMMDITGLTRNPTTLVRLSAGMAVQVSHNANGKFNIYIHFTRLQP